MWMRSARCARRCEPAVLPRVVGDVSRADRIRHASARRRKFSIAGLTAEAIAQKHPGVSYAYRLNRDGKALVYSTDAEHAMSDAGREAPFVAFARGADLLIFEAMFTRDEVNYDKAGWGHASNLDAVELAALARVGRLALFHHDPASDDARLTDFEADARRYAAEVAEQTGGYPREVFMARDGMELAL